MRILLAGRKEKDLIAESLPVRTERLEVLPLRIEPHRGSSPHITVRNDKADALAGSGRPDHQDVRGLVRADRRPTHLAEDQALLCQQVFPFGVHDRAEPRIAVVHWLAVDQACKDQADGDRHDNRDRDRAADDRLALRGMIGQALAEMLPGNEQAA